MSASSPPVVVLEEFLAPVEVAWLWMYAVEREACFVGSQVVGSDAGGREDREVRRSRVLYDVAPVEPLLTDRVLRYLPSVIQLLGHAEFPISSVELQVTASNDGEWFRPHSDGSHGPVQSRELTMVYFCHREPRPFTGGELRIYPAFAASDISLQPARVITPTQNSMVFFPAHYLHEVTEVTCPSKLFVDSRFTYNGWLHR